jgi:hypothetical protein
MQTDVTDRLWVLYCRHVAELEEDARLVRQTFRMTGTEVVRVHPLTRQEFEQCLASPGKDPAVKGRWLGRMLQLAEDDRERVALAESLGLVSRGGVLKGPHFARLQEKRQPAGQDS